VTPEPSAGGPASASPATAKVPAAASGTDRSARPSGSGPLPEADPESSPVVRNVRGMLGRGEYALAVRTTFKAAFEGTVRAYGLTVPPSCTDRQFVAGFLRPDMGKLTELLPELYRRYEPVRFGKPGDGDRASFETLLLRLFSETVLGRIADPLFQPSGPVSPVGEPSESSWPFRTSRKGKAP